MKINRSAFTKKARLGLGTGVIDYVKRSDDTVDPIVKEVVNESNIDIYTTLPEQVFCFDRVFLFIALLTVHHPAINKEIQIIRKNLGISRLLKYTKKFDPEEGFFNTSLDIIDSTLKENLENELKSFFKEVGKNLNETVWKHSIATFILTGTLPLPFIPRDQFEVYGNVSSSDLEKIQGYTVIVIKRRIRQRELNPLIQFIQDSESQLVTLTKNLPRELIKRSDINITRLAIGLWLNKHTSFSNDEVEKLVKEKYKENGQFFGEFDDENNPLEKTEFPGLKSEALGYLKRLHHF